jgi:tetratricopeptide (TPR) repeat protein
MSETSGIPSGLLGASDDSGNAVQQSLALIRSGKHADAVNLLFSHLSAEPEDTTALGLLPGALFAAGRHEEALTLSASSADAYPTDPDLILAYAEVASSMMLWDESIKAAEDVIELRPSSFDAYRILAVALSAVQRLPEADAAMRRAVELGEADGEPETELLVLKSAVLSDWPGRKEEGIGYARQAVALDPTNDRFRSRLAALQMGMRDYWGAVRTSLGVLATSPTRDVARGTLLIALASTQYRTIWLQFGLVFLTAVVGIGGFGELLGMADDTRLAGHVVGVFGTVLNALLVWRIHRKVGGNKVMYRTILRTVRKFTGAHYALWLQALAVLLPLVAAVTGFVFVLTAPFFLLIVASSLFRLSHLTMVRTGALLYGPEVAEAAGIR